jgi:NAD(P)-dependent dehydrogenase (short-subunit alcohol dehydrogenase family)
MRFRDKVCLITGGGSGIGRKTAVLMAREGAKVAVLSRTMEEVEEAVEEIRSEGNEAIPVCADISEPEELKAAVDEVVKAYGGIDFVFANAGVNGVWAPIEDLEVEEWDQTIAINLRGTFLTLKYTVPHLKKRGGSIVVNASVNGTRVFSNSGATAYASSKAAQVAMTKMLALELAPSGVRVNVICPGAIDTGIQDNTDARGIEELGVPVDFPQGMHPLRGGPADSEHVARVVLFLASDDAEHVTGTELWVDGAESLIGMRG